MKLTAQTNSAVTLGEESSLPYLVPLWVRFASWLLLLGGAGAIALALGADLLGVGGLPGFGLKQIKVAFVGAALLAGGMGLAFPGGQRYLREWFLLGLAALVIVAGEIPVEAGSHLALELQRWTGVALVAVAVGGAAWAVGRQRAAVRLQSHLMAAGQWMAIVVQFGLLVVVIGAFSLENSAFYNQIMPIAFCGFLVHFFLPLPYRLPFFLLLSLVGIISVFGFVDGAWLVALGVLLILICHVPVAFGLRVGLLLLAGAALALLRTEWSATWVQLPWSRAVWPILGSMFMFRLIVYMYDLRHRKEPVDATRTLAYFFLLPNVVFPLFPVMDFTTFRRTYYDGDRFRIYQTGLDWMLRGVIQLILYRFVSYYLLIAPEDVTNAGQLVQYLLTNFLLYLRVSGQFHIIVGLLHMFGFNLPETHHLYFLASSFVDFWRRINIYWKDFMLKVFYYPAYFRLRKLGQIAGLVLATCFVFFATWLFHGYQWFWLRGSFLLTWPDVLFWTLLALLVVVNSLYELKRGRKRSLGGQSWSWRELSTLSMRVAITFSVICVLWSLWTSASIAEWLAMWSVIGNPGEGSMGLLASFVLGAVVVGVVAGSAHRSSGPGGTTAATAKRTETTFVRSAGATGLVLVGLALLANPTVCAQLGTDVCSFVSDMKTARLSSRDAVLLERGYYEDLTGVNRFNSELWEIYSRQPQQVVNLRDTAVAQMTDDFLRFELRPSTEIIFHGALLRTNRWGMRDQEYEQAKPAGTYRIALLGPSYVMGYGVANAETFEAVIERRLNQEYAQKAGQGDHSYEILNFAVGGYSVLQDLMVLDEKALGFQPDMVLHVAHPNERQTVVDHLYWMVSEGERSPYEWLNERVASAAIPRDATRLEMEKELDALAPEVVAWAYRQIVEKAQAAGARPVWAFITLPEPYIADESRDELMQLAEQAGFVVMDLSHIYEGQDINALRIAEWDRHPNVRGHRLIADRLYEELLQALSN